MRLNIKLSDEMGKKVTTFSQSFGMSKSAFMAYCIGSHIRLLESQQDVVDTLSNAISDKIQKSPEPAMQ